MAIGDRSPQSPANGGEGLSPPKKIQVPLGIATFGDDSEHVLETQFWQNRSLSTGDENTNIANVGVGGGRRQQAVRHFQERARIISRKIVFHTQLLFADQVGSSIVAAPACCQVGAIFAISASR